MIIVKCIQCKKDKQVIEFTLFRGKRNKTCGECRVKNNLWYSQDLAGRKTKAKERYVKRRISIAQYRSDLRLNRKYKLSRIDWNLMLNAQNKKCLLCNKEFMKEKPCVDHDHATGKIRGLLHRVCNLKLQAIEDSEFSQKAQLYLDSKK